MVRKKLSIWAQAAVAGIALIMTLASPGAAADKVVKITIPAHITPAYHDMFPSVKGFVDRLNELGQGRIKAELYHSESLYKVKDIVPALMNGSCEIVFHTSSHTTGAWPELGGLTLPFLYKDATEARRYWSADGKIMELINKEMGRKYGVRVLAAAIMPPLVLATREKGIEKFGDLKGLKIRASGKPDAAALQACGAAPNFMASGEVYEALQRGTIDGLVTYTGTIPARNLQEVLKYLIDMKPVLGLFGYQIYVLNKTLDSWDPAIREAVLKAAAEYDSVIFEKATKYIEAEIKPMIGQRIKTVAPDAEAMKRFVELGRGTYDDWLKSVDPNFGKQFMTLSTAPLK
jgi:TRAP-type C4-dicarboxylate transport system substrate-binding protein